MNKKSDKKTLSKRTSGDQKLNRWTDNSNSYEEVDPAEHEPQNSVFPSNKGKMNGPNKKK
jgi:hypothetical protein